MSTAPFGAECYDITSLLDTLGEIPDPRDQWEKIYSLSFLLAVILVATPTGAKCPREFHRRAADLPQSLLAVLGAPRDFLVGGYREPSEKTIRLLLKKIDVDALDTAFGSWLCAQAAPGQVAFAIDVKVLRGAWSGKDAQVRLLSAMLHGKGAVRVRVRIPDDTNEITHIQELVTKLPKNARPTSHDARRHTHPARHRETPRENRMDYILTVKGNQPTLERQTFERILPLLQETPHHEVEERAHGRIKNWQTWTRTAEIIDFPHVETACVIRRDEFDLTGVRISREHALILSSTPSERATAAYLHNRTRRHWGIENEIHYTRDTAWREDANPTYTGNTNHALASFRNLAIGVIRLSGARKIKETIKHVAANRYRALQLIATVCNGAGL
ncbi:MULTISPECIES: ISAs1 family transposase [Frankia]|nr:MULTISPECIES: ISAs1 family transposase [Frankia]